MEFFTILLEVAKTRPELMVIVLPIIMWLSERAERKAQQEVNKGLTDRLLELTDNTAEKLTEQNVLLQILVGRKR